MPTICISIKIYLKWGIHITRQHKLCKVFIQLAIGFQAKNHLTSYNMKEWTVACYHSFKLARDHKLNTQWKNKCQNKKQISWQTGPIYDHCCKSLYVCVIFQRKWTSGLSSCAVFWAILIFFMNDNSLRENGNWSSLNTNYLLYKTKVF